MSFDDWFENLFRHQEENREPKSLISVDTGWYQTALKHYCAPCDRWFGDTRGKLMHDRHRHKNNE